MELIETYTKQDTVNIRFEMKGSEFDGDKNLHYILDGLNNFVGAIEKTYLTLANKSRMTAKDREVLQLRTVDFKDGSFITDISLFVMAITELSLQSLPVLTPEGIRDLFEWSFKYLEFILSKKDEGGGVVVHNNGNGTVNVIQIDNDGNENEIIVVPDQAIPLSNKTKGHFKKLSSLIDNEQGVDEINIYGSSSDTVPMIKIDNHKKELFSSEEKTDWEPFVIMGKIVKADGIEGTGKITIIESEDTEVFLNQEYYFHFFDKPNEDEWANIFLKEVKFKVVKSVSFDTSKLINIVTKLRIMEVV